MVVHGGEDDSRKMRWLWDRNGDRQDEDRDGGRKQRWWWTKTMTEMVMDKLGNDGWQRQKYCGENYDDG